MSANSKIEWCDHTFNPWIGCTRVSPGCDNCYAAVSTPARAMHVTWGATEPRHRTGASNWATPKIWNGGHDAFFGKHHRRQRVFCASLADVFDNQVPDEWRADLFELVRTTPNLDWLLLTKRPQNIVRMVQSHGAIAGNGTRYLPSNVWLGTTAEDQTRADQNIPALLRTIGELGARITFVSIEPMLGPVQIFSEITSELLHTSGNDYEPGWISWVIAGGESGSHARPMHPDWARGVRGQCAAAGVPFLFKQWGEYADADSCVGGDWPVVVWNDGGISARVGKKAAGRLLDGVTHDGFPEPRP